MKMSENNVNDNGAKSHPQLACYRLPFMKPYNYRSYQWPGPARPALGLQRRLFFHDIALGRFGPNRVKVWAVWVISTQQPAAVPAL